jgi:hypothetical protein
LPLKDLHWQAAQNPLTKVLVYFALFKNEIFHENRNNSLFHYQTIGITIKKSIDKNSF